MVTKSTTVLLVMPMYVSVVVAAISQHCGKAGHLHTGLCYFWRRPEYGVVCPLSRKILFVCPDRVSRIRVVYGSPLKQTSPKKANVDESWFINIGASLPAVVV